MTEATGHVAFIGAGKMGGALIAGLVQDPRVGAQRISVVEKNPDQAALIREQYGVACVELDEAARSAETLILVTKPADVPAVAAQLSQQLKPGALVISMAAGITTATIEAVLAPGTPVIRVMPNTPALVGQGMSVMSPGSATTAEHLARAEAILSAVGRVAQVPEAHQDAVTAVSGSGPAYIFLIVETMMATAQNLGLDPDVAATLVRQTVLGAATMAAQTGEDPAVLRQNVTSPGGTTAAALGVMEEADLRGIFDRALAAARDRSIELGRNN